MTALANRAEMTAQFLLHVNEESIYARMEFASLNEKIVKNSQVVGQGNLNVLISNALHQLPNVEIQWLWTISNALKILSIVSKQMNARKQLLNVL